MKKSFVTLLFIFAPVFAQAAPDAADPGLLSRSSPYPVAETLDQLEALLNAKGGISPGTTPTT